MQTITAFNTSSQLVKPSQKPALSQSVGVKRKCVNGPLFDTPDERFLHAAYKQSRVCQHCSYGYCGCAETRFVRSVCAVPTAATPQRRHVVERERENDVLIVSG